MHCDSHITKPVIPADALIALTVFSQGISSYNIDLRKKKKLVYDHHVPQFQVSR